MKTSISGHSAVVTMNLRLGSAVIPVRQLAPTFLIVEGHHDLESGTGEIALTVDGHLTLYQVQLPEGISSTRARQAATFNPAEQLAGAES
jgi:hypothetical protein